MDKSQSAANGRPAQKKRGSKGQKHKYRTAPDGVEYRRHALEGRIAQSALTSREEKVRQQQQQLQARRTQLIQTCRDKFREAAAAKAEGHRATMWANNLIFSELAGNKISKAMALEARLVDTGYVNLPAARRAAAAKEKRELHHGLGG